MFVEKKMIALLASLVLLTGCETAGPVTDRGFCSVGRPIYVSKQDVLTEGTADQIEAHNGTGARVCGWR
jgi:hypothetical protein